MAMMTRLGRIGLHRDEEPAATLEEGVADAGQPVEQDLDEEDARQRRTRRAEQVGVDLVGHGDAVEPEDQRRGDDRERGERDHQRRRGRDHDVGGAGVLGVVLSPSPREERGEQRDERRRQHAAQQQVVDDVRRLVAELVGVAERGLPDHVREHEHAQQSGDA